jgi:predicted ester cyclase
MALAPDDVDRLLQRFAVHPWNTGDIESLDAVVAEGYVLHPDSTLDDLKQAVRSARHGLPDLTVTIEETVAEADKIAYRWTMRGTHLGEMDGIAPTGKSVAFTGITILTVKDGKVLKDRYESSSPSLEQQVLDEY